MQRTTARTAMLGLAAAAITACSDTATQPTSSPLAGLVNATATDTAGRPIPQPPASSTPGRFYGTVLGQSPAGAGNDSLATAPRLAGVVVTAYATIGVGSPNPTLGPIAASVTTGADGKFALPSMPGGTYIVTFAPPAGYVGAWVTATASATSGDFAWWVVLGKR